MKLTIELELEASYHEHDNGSVTLETLSFPNCTQNLLQFMTDAQKAQAQALLEEAREDDAIKKVERLLEKRAMRGDWLRDQARDDGMTGAGE